MSDQAEPTMGQDQPCLSSPAGDEINNPRRHWADQPPPADATYDTTDRADTGW